jgi:hypothetical protein
VHVRVSLHEKDHNTQAMVDGGMEALQCPLTLYIFRDPVVGSDGHTYEREVITNWLRISETSSLTKRVYEH